MANIKTKKGFPRKIEIQNCKKGSTKKELNSAHKLLKTKKKHTLKESE